MVHIQFQCQLNFTGRKRCRFIPRNKYRFNLAFKDKRTPLHREKRLNWRLKRKQGHTGIHPTDWRLLVFHFVYIQVLLSCLFQSPVRPFSPSQWPFAVRLDALAPPTRLAPPTHLQPPCYVTVVSCDCPAVHWAEDWRGGGGLIHWPELFETHRSVLVRWLYSPVS